MKIFLQPLNENRGLDYTLRVQVQSNQILSIQNEQSEWLYNLQSWII